MLADDNAANQTRMDSPRVGMPLGRLLAGNTENGACRIGSDYSNSARRKGQICQNPSNCTNFARFFIAARSDLHGKLLAVSTVLPWRRNVLPLPRLVTATRQGLNEVQQILTKDGTKSRDGSQKRANF